MSIEFFIRKDYESTAPFTGVQTIKQQLINKLALVVFDKEKFIGVISIADLAKKTHNLVVDSITEKPSIQVDCPVNDALEIMTEKMIDVLPVWKDDVFLGLVFKNDLLNYLKSASKNS